MPFTEHPGIHAQRRPAAPGARLRVGRPAQLLATQQQFVLAQRVIPAVGMFVKQAGDAPAVIYRFDKISRDGLAVVQLQDQLLQDIAIPFGLVEQPRGDRAVPGGQVAQEAVE